MAFLKTATNPTTGEEITAYHRVATVNTSPAEKRAHVEVLIYLSQAASEAAKSNSAIRPIGVRVFDVNDTRMVETGEVDAEGNPVMVSAGDYTSHWGIEVQSAEGNNAVKAAYEYIGGLEEFADKVDAL